MLNITIHQGNANQNFSEITSHLSEWLSSKKKKEYKCGEGYEKGNSPILLVRAATVENSMEACQKTKNKVTI